MGGRFLTFMAGALLFASSVNGADAQNWTATTAHYESWFPYEACGLSASNACRRVLPLTPSNGNGAGSKFILVKNVSCYIYTTHPIRLLRLNVATSISGSPLRNVNIPLQGNSFMNNYYHYMINSPVYFLIGPDRYPSISVEMFAPAVTYMTCSIAGDFVK